MHLPIWHYVQSIGLGPKEREGINSREVYKTDVISSIHSRRPKNQVISTSLGNMPHLPMVWGMPRGSPVWGSLWPAWCLQISPCNGDRSWDHIIQPNGSQQQTLGTPMVLGKLYDLNQRPHHTWWLIEEIIPKCPNNSGQWIIVIYPDGFEVHQTQETHENGIQTWPGLLRKHCR